MRKNKKLYTICKPTKSNEKSGNFCISLHDIMKFDKDFLFEQTINNKKISKIISKEYVKDNMKMYYCTKYDEYGNRTCFPFAMISLDAILKF